MTLQNNGHTGIRYVKMCAYLLNNRYAFTWYVVSDLQIKIITSLNHMQPHSDVLIDRYTTLTKRRQKCITNLTSEWNLIQQQFFPHASRSLLCIRFFVVAFRSEDVFEEEDPLRLDLILPPPPRADMAETP